MRTTFSILAILLACLQVSHAYVIKPVTQTLGTKLTPKGNPQFGRKSRLNYKDQEGEETIQVSRKMGSNEVFFHPVHTQPELHEQPTVKVGPVGLVTSGGVLIVILAMRICQTCLFVVIFRPIFDDRGLK